jgi:hypothetical protein
VFSDLVSARCGAAGEITICDVLDLKYEDSRITRNGCQLIASQWKILHDIQMALELDDAIDTTAIFKSSGFPIPPDDDPRVLKWLERGRQDYDTVYLNKRTEIKSQLSAPKEGNVFIDLDKLIIHGESQCPFWAYGIPNFKLNALPLVLLMPKEKLLKYCEIQKENSRTLKQSDLTGSHGYTPGLDIFLRDMLKNV